MGYIGNSPALNESVTSAQIADNAIITAKINNDAVTGDKIENSPTIASNLTVTGDLSVTGAAPGWQLVSAAVPSAATYLDISINTAARYHRIVLAGIKGNVDDKQFKVQVGYGESPTILAGTSYLFAEWSTSSAEASNMNGVDGAAMVVLTEFAPGNDTGEGVLLLDLRLHTSNPTDDRIAAHWKQCSRFETGVAVNTTGVFTCDTGGNVINTVRFLWQTTCDFANVGEAYYYTLLED